MSDICRPGRCGIRSSGNIPGRGLYGRPSGEGCSGTGGTQIPITFRITKWSTQDEIKILGALLKEKGQDALLNEIKSYEAGRINTTGETGNQIAIAEKWQNGDQTVITMISARRMTMYEQKSRSRGASKKYPFAYLQVVLNANGEGSGKLLEAAAVRYDKDKETYRLDP